jgi:hypothetical protein
MLKKIAALALVSFTALPALADGVDVPCPSSVPASVQPAANQRLRASHSASGVQIYMCNATPAGAFTWQFVAPQANLFDNDGNLVITHFIGPVWQANDASAVKAAKAGAATVDPASIPWLLLTSVGNVGPGKLADITSVQRLNTNGGIAPAASDCTQATAGKLVQVPYTADYFFYDTHDSTTNLQCR